MQTGLTRKWSGAGLILSDESHFCRPLDEAQGLHPTALFFVCAFGVQRKHRLQWWKSRAVSGLEPEMRDRKAAMESFVIFITFNYFIQSLLTSFGADVFGVDFTQEVGGASGLTTVASLRG